MFSILPFTCIQAGLSQGGRGEALHPKIMAAAMPAYDRSQRGVDETMTYAAGGVPSQRREQTLAIARIRSY
jgi:hypothetical protein